MTVPGIFRPLRPWAGVAVLCALALLSACNRGRAPMTACEGDKPTVARIKDVAPPNCPKN